MRRKDRRNKPEQAPAPVPVEALPAPVPAADELQALRERLALVEQQQQPVPPTPVAARLREQERWAVVNTRTGHTDPCPACGLLGGKQRRLLGSMWRKSPTWVCMPCAETMVDGLGSNSIRTYTQPETLDRLACSAAGMDRPTRTFRALALRYGLTFTLAMDSDGGDGTAWSHLGDLERWRDVGTRAIRREEAGFGVFPMALPSALHPEMVDGRLPDPSHPRGWRFAAVPKPVEQPSAAQLAAQLAAEEEAIETALTAQARRAAETAETAARKAERARINREYRAAVKAQEKLFSEHRRKLREARAMVLESADTRADFDAIVRGL